VRQIKLFCFTVIVCGLVLTACSEAPKPAGPKFTGRLLLLSGDASNGANLSELIANGDKYNVSTVTSGVREAVANPDQSRLLYATKDEILMRDLQTGAVKSLVKGESNCLAWAPDGNHFSYKQTSGKATKFYASDLEGRAKLILEDPNGSTDCARWIAPDRLVFDRFVGATMQKGGEPLKPNTTTVATIGDPVKLKDTPRKWTVESYCAKTNNGFVRSADQGRLLIAKNIDHFESLDPAPAPCSECRFVGYAAQSCVPFFVEQSLSTSTDLFYLNPTNWQKQKPASINRTFSPNAKMLIKSSARLMVVGDAGSLLLIDTESGEITSLIDTPATAAAPAEAKAPIVWIEK
jgi:hypothetical protein